VFVLVQVQTLSLLEEEVEVEMLEVGGLNET
jgi:hypothetical protein